jgi:hypothetical protein
MDPKDILWVHLLAIFRGDLPGESDDPGEDQPP